jgi:peptidyl-prolyl cis-trans isomerase A (cyclophilin A)
MDRRTAIALGGTYFCGALAGCSSTESTEQQTPESTAHHTGTAQHTDTEQKRETAATLQTSFGDIAVTLHADRAPRTVENFVGLATGEREWTNPATGNTVSGDPLYDDVLFHRVIDEFIIQTGDPLGTGRGGPGYTFDDEFHDDLRHDSAGVLSMANSGPDTNGSQFFITLSPQPHLDGRHSVFGQVTDGMDVVNEIGAVETDENDRPVEPVYLESVSVQ